MPFCAELHHRELIGPHAAGTDIADLSVLDKIMQGGHGFFDGRFSVEAVYLEEIDVVGIEAGKRS